MTTTSIKDVGSVLGAAVVSSGNASQMSKESFRSIWNAQAGVNSDSGESIGNAVKQRDDVRPGDDLRAKEHTRKDIDKDVEKVSDRELSEEDLEKVAEVAGGAMAELIQQIADTFGISVEEVQAIMADMNLEPMDLLQGENLSALLLQVSGAKNSLALLTNEELYADYQMLMEQGKAVAAECCEALGISMDELVQMMQMQADEEMTESVPVVQVETENEGDVISQQTGNETAPQNTVVETQTTETAGEQTGDKQSHSEDANAGNLVLQTIKNEIAQPQTEQVQAPTSLWNAETQDIMQQIMDYMKLQVKPDMSNLEMQLHPASLGKLQIYVASEGGVLTANFVTENETVKAVLESQLVQLKENFAEQGVKVNAIEVTVQTHQFEQNLEQGRERQTQSEAAGTGRTRTRRINLNALEGLDGMDLPDELDESDRITAEMMAANGQTVDYTA